MGTLKKTAIIAVVLLGATAIATWVAPRSASSRRDEAWLAKQLPDEVAGYRYLPSQDDPTCTYKMDPLTYEILQPNGINARRYGLGARTFDVVIIESNNSDSFHDPTVCFTSQGHDIVSQTTHLLKTKTRGDIPLTLLQTKHESAVFWAAYAYKGPNGMKDAPLPLLLDLFASELKTSQVPNGVFYRFMGLSPVGTKDELLAFASDYFDQLGETSNGEL